MKTLLKIVGGLALFIVAFVFCIVLWLSIRRPWSRAASTEKIEATPARLARGEYVVEHVSDCLGCHSDHVVKFGFPVKPGTEGVGGFVFDKKLGFPGVVAAQNITSDPDFGLGKWTDGEILRAIREGIDRKGDALFPMMPYKHFRYMSDEDAKSVVVYLRTLKPLHRGVPDKHIDFPVNLFVKFAPQPLSGPVSAPDPKTDHIAYGGYLVRIGGCIECHSPHDDKNNLIEAKMLSGGWQMIGPWGRNFTPNLTPDATSYLGRATRDEFIGRFKAFEAMNAENSPTAQAGRNTIMPWLAFSHMTEDDLGAIYDYLTTLKPIPNKVNPFPDAVGAGS